MERIQGSDQGLSDIWLLGSHLTFDDAFWSLAFDQSLNEELSALMTLFDSILEFDEEENLDVSEIIFCNVCSSYLWSHLLSQCLSDNRLLKRIPRFKLRVHLLLKIFYAFRTGIVDHRLQATRLFLG